MGISRYWKSLLLVVLLMMPLLAQAGKWTYRCKNLAESYVSCDDIGDAAASSVTNLFTNMYPHNEYLILFTVNGSRYSGGYFSYDIIASLHKFDKGGWLKFPSIADHSHSGYHSNPSYAYQRRLLLDAAEKATASLVSNVTDR
jgi:hypothetical protein